MQVVMFGVVVFGERSLLSPKIKSRYSYESQLQYALNRDSFFQCRVLHAFINKGEKGTRGRQGVDVIS